MMQVKIPQTFKNNPNLHAYLLLSGDKRVRENTARHIAMAMLCRNPGDGSEPCGECDCCIKCKAGTHPDCIVFDSGEKTTVKSIRGIEDEAYLATNEADAKVFILCDADEYNIPSQNTLLKIVEEPPRGVKFILTASSKHALLPTVRSRVCTLSAETRSFDGLYEDVLAHKSGLDGDGARRIASLVYAYDRLDARDVPEKACLSYIQSAVMLFSSQTQDIESVFPKGREELMLCLQVFMQASREIALAKCNGKAEDGMLDVEEISTCAAKCSMKRIHSLYDIFEEAYIMANEYANVNALRAHLMQSIK